MLGGGLWVLGSGRRVLVLGGAGAGRGISKWGWGLGWALAGCGSLGVLGTGAGWGVLGLWGGLECWGGWGGVLARVRVQPLVRLSAFGPGTGSWDGAIGLWHNGGVCLSHAPAIPPSPPARVTQALSPTWTGPRTGSSSCPTQATMRSSTVSCGGLQWAALGGSTGCGRIGGKGVAWGWVSLGVSRLAGGGFREVSMGAGRVGSCRVGGSPWDGGCGWGCMR